MSNALSGEQRTALEKLVQNGRRWFEDDLADTLSGKYGVNADGKVEAIERLELTNAQVAIHDSLVEIVEHLRGEGEDAAGSVDRLVREAAFTHLNRLVAVRVAEAIGLLPETIARGLASSGFKDFSEVAAGAATTDWGRFAIFVRLCGDELARDVPALFDPRNPLLELEPTEAALERFVGAIIGLDDAVWSAPDALGWVYQFFNTGEERKAMREGSAAPRNSRELSVRNQFFTPSYVVDFLVHNGLGAYLAAGVPGLVDDLPLLLTPPTEQREIDLDAVSVLDPACGSGHFLLGAYDVLERAWHHAGVEPSAAAPAIVASLWGVDIDPRVTQIAQAAIIFRARRHCRTGFLPRPNVVCARALPAGPAVDALVASQPANVGRAVRAIAEDLTDAPVLGPLLRVEERLDREARDLFGTGVVEGTLSQFAADNAEAAVLDALAAIADSTTSTAAQRLFAAEAHDAVRFVEAMTRRYTAVLMNPPFGDPVGSTKDYLKAAYRDWIPTTNDLFALFVGRGLELAGSGGSVGAITSRVGLFLTSFKQWRSRVVLHHELGPLVDLGEKVMEQATVDAAAYVLQSQVRRQNHRPTMIRALTMMDRAVELPQVIEAVRAGDRDHPAVFHPDLDALAKLNEQPIVYWIDADDVETLNCHKPFEPAQGVVRQGLATGDDFRFVRAWWEVAAQRSTYPPQADGGATTEEQLSQDRRWVPIVKAGSSQPWFSPNLLVVDWERDGERLRNFVDAAGKLRSRPQNTDRYFKPGFSWTRRAPRLVPYVVPEGCIPSVSRYQAFPAADPYGAIAVSASNVASAFARFYGEKFLWPNFLVENVKTIPIPTLAGDLADRAAAHVERQVAERRAVFHQLEPFREFVAPRDRAPDLSWDRRTLLGDDLDMEIARAYGFSDVAYRRLVADLWEALEMLGDSADAADDDAEDAVATQTSWLDRLTSYLVGVAFGRWDVRIGVDQALAPRQLGAFAPPSPVPPGMLVDELGVPAVETPDSYPVPFPASGCLIDQPGHIWDLESRVRAAATEFLGSDSKLDEVVSTEMSRPSLANYMRGSFFKAHLRTYSQGRRKAPIYWQLQVPSKTWGVWLYYPRMSRETLFALVGLADQRLRLAEQQVAHLQREAEAGGGGRKASELAAELEAERKLAVELATFKAEAERIANLGWEPDLDDGAVLNAAPLAELFPAWKDAAGNRKELRAGKHSWATVARYADQL